MQKLCHTLTFMLFILSTSSLPTQRRLLSQESFIKIDKDLNQTRILTQNSNLKGSNENQNDENQTHIGQIQSQNAPQGIDSCETDFDFFQKTYSTKTIFQKGINFEFIGQFKSSLDSQNQQDEEEHYFIVKVDQQHRYAKELFQKEVFIAQKLSQIDGINMPTYQNCYRGFKINDNLNGFATQYEKVGDSLDLQYNKETKTIQNPVMQQYFLLSKEQRIKNVIQLFQSLVAIHNEKITLRNISPLNIKTNIDLELLERTSEQPHEIKLYFTNYQYAFFQQQTPQAIYFPDSKYIHPETRIMEQREKNPLNDVYSLCASYFQIEMFNPEQIAEEDDGLNITYVVGSEDLSDTDVLGHDIRYYEKEQKVRAAINAQRQRIQQTVFTKFTQDNTLAQKIYEAINYTGQNKFQGRLDRLLQVCQNDCDCIMFSGFQYKLEDTPTSELIATALQRCNFSDLVLI